MLRADAMVDATEPRLQVAEDEVDDRQELFGHLGVAAFGDGVVVEAACPQAVIAAPIVGDDPGARHDGILDETTQRIGAAVGSHGQPHAPGVASILPLVLRGAGFPLADFDGGSYQRLVVNAAAFTACPASDIRLVDLDIFSFSGTDPILIGPHHGRAELDEGRVDEVIAALLGHAASCEEARKNAEYFSTNRERMNYPKFRQMGLCVVSGVVKGGCKNIVGARLKQGGMRWTVGGANAIIALRCAVESNRFDDFWERRADARA